MYNQSRFRWTAEHVFDVATIYTSGQLDFRTLNDLRKLRTAQDDVSDYGAQARNALAERLNALQTVLGGKSAVAATVGLTDIEARHATWNLTFTSVAERTNLNVRGVLEDLPFANPLIEAWELAQLCRLYEATVDVMEDTLTDSAVELLGRGVPEQDIAMAAGSLTPEGLHARIRWVGWATAT